MAADVPELVHRGQALFLDFDGTLADLADRPDAVVVEPGLVRTLAELHLLLGGALAVISGRPIAQIDTYLAPAFLPVAGVHGAERRSASGRMEHLAQPDLAPLAAELDQLAATRPGVLLERKPGALALHYRQAPACSTWCLETMVAAARRVPGLKLMHGKAVVELMPAQASKARAIEAFIAEPPFAGRVPLFAGDDVTDESGFDHVQSLGGTGIKVGPGDSVALYRLESPSALRGWLRDAITAVRTASPTAVSTGLQGVDDAR